MAVHDTFHGLCVTRLNLCSWLQVHLRQKVLCIVLVVRESQALLQGVHKSCALPLLQGSGGAVEYGPQFTRLAENLIGSARMVHIC